VVRELVAEDLLYVSLNYEDDDLKKIMPWAAPDAAGQEEGRSRW
jgi:hypothetical protein